MNRILRRLSIGVRLQLATATSVAAVCILLLGVYFYESAHIESARLDALRFVVQSAISVAAADEAEEQAGRLTQAEAQRTGLAALRAIRFNAGDYVFVIDRRAMMIMDPPKPELEGKDVSTVADPNGKRLFAVMVDLVRSSGSGVVDYLWPRLGSAAPQPKLSYVKAGPWGWIIGSGVYVDDLDRARHSLAMLLMACGGGATLVVGLVIWRLGRSVSRPTRALATVTAALASGTLEVEIVGAERDDELGALARALQVLKINSVERVRLERATADDRAAHDRRQMAIDRHTQDFGTVMSGVFAGLNNAAAGMQSTAERMCDNTARTLDRARLTAEDGEAAARDLATVASATEQLSASVTEIARQVAHATSATQDAVERAAETDATFERLREMAERIDNDGRAISGIAAQTNLLALNATIEAARAGEAGRGFAVVAGEVKALASQTADATTAIGQNVFAIREANANTATAIRDVGGAIRRVDEVATAIAAAIEEQGATTREIAASTQAIAMAGERSAAALVEVASITEATGEMSFEVLKASQEIGTVAVTLGNEVKHFLSAMSSDDGFRRRFERIPGNGQQATLVAPGHAERTALVKDISVGGAALQAQWSGNPGDELNILLADFTAPVGARIVRVADGVLAVAFFQDPATQARVTSAMQHCAAAGPLREAA
jgi:methyl-accepting chemotaxis protein